MEGQNYLGIYISRNTATAVCLDSQGVGRKVPGCFSVCIEEQEELSTKARAAELAGLIAQGCADRQLRFSQVFVALDCATFMQHNVHSEFADPKQIAATVRFDAEEALATDISELAIAFDVISKDDTGSNLTVFTTERKLLSEIILALQNNNMDPVAVEPDISCLSRFIRDKVSPVESEAESTLFGILSDRNGYFILPDFSGSQKQQGTSLRKVRTFLVNARQDRSELLAREIPLTAALFEADWPVNCVRGFDSAGAVNYEHLGEKLGINTGEIDLAASAGIEPEDLADCGDLVGFAIAYGAALAHSEKEQGINFRNDFMPYQGKKQRLEKTLKFLSISITILLIAVGLLVTLQLFGKGKPRKLLRARLTVDYLAVLLNKDEMPPRLTAAVRALNTELGRVKREKSGQLSATGEKSIAAKLMLVLNAFNKCASQTDLSIDKITITAKSIRVTGDTSSSQNTLKLFEEFRKCHLDIQDENVADKGGRGTFSVKVVPKRGS